MRTILVCSNEILICSHKMNGTFAQSTDLRPQNSYSVHTKCKAWTGLYLFNILLTGPTFRQTSLWLMHNRQLLSHRPRIQTLLLYWVLYLPVWDINAFASNAQSSIEMALTNNEPLDCEAFQNVFVAHPQLQVKLNYQIPVCRVVSQCSANRTVKKT